MITENVSIKIKDEMNVSGIIARPDVENADRSMGIIFAHGTSNDMHHPSIVALSQGLAGSGFVTMRFNFPFREMGLKSPNSDPVLIQTWKQAVSFFQKKAGPGCSKIIAVGKSLGARIASIAVAEKQIKPDGLIFLGYPLHPPGKKHLLKDAHLYGIETPMLFFEGTRDPFCDLKLLKGVLDKLACPHELEIIQGGDHGFSLPKSDPRSDSDVYEQVIDRSLKWLLDFL